MNFRRFIPISQDDSQLYLFGRRYLQTGEYLCFFHIFPEPDGAAIESMGLRGQHYILGTHADIQRSPLIAPWRSDEYHDRRTIKHWVFQLVKVDAMRKAQQVAHDLFRLAESRLA